MSSGSTLASRRRRLAAILFGAAALATVQAANAAPMYGCSGIGVLIDSYSQAALDSEGRVCYLIPGATVSTTGLVTAAVPLEAPHTTMAVYDDRNQLVTDTSPGDVTTTQYDGAGRLTQSIDTEPSQTFTTTYTYDGMSREVQTTDPQGHTTSYTYDSINRVITEIDPGQTFTYTYDSEGNLVSRSDGAGTTTTYTYDADGEVLQVNDGNGHITTFTYDALDRVVSTTDVAGTTQYTYDNGLLHTLTDPSSNITSFTYDSRGNVIEADDPQGTTSFIYTTELIPEPSSLAVLASSLFGLAGLARRRRRRRG